MQNVYVEKADTLYFNSNKDQSFKITTEEKFRNNFGAFTAVLTLKSLTTRIHYMDAYDIVISLSKKEQEIFQEIKNFSDRDLRIAAMDHWEDLDKSIQGALYQRLAHIKEVGLIRKIHKMPIPKGMQDKALTARVVNLLTNPGKFTFIINPAIIMGFEVNSARAIWNQLEEKQNKEI